MKTVIKEQQSTEWTFPCLARHNQFGFIIGASSEVIKGRIRGTVISDNEYFSLFNYADDWAKSAFTPIPTPVTIDFIP